MNNFLLMQIWKSFKHLLSVTASELLRQWAELFDLILYWALKHHIHISISMISDRCQSGMIYASSEDSESEKFSQEP